MTVLGTAAAVYVGNVAAVAVYAGSVKVWPIAPPGPPPSMVIVGAKFGVWLKSPVPQADLKGPQPYPVTFDLDPTWFDSSSPHPYWVDGDGEVMVVRGPDGALSTREQVRDWAHGATLTWVDSAWRLDPADAPPPQPKPGADGIGQWLMDDPASPGQLVLSVVTTGGVDVTPQVVDVEPYTGTTQAASNPWRGMVIRRYDDLSTRHTRGMAAQAWNNYYPAQWGGHRLSIIIGPVDVTAITDLGVSPA
jgi:hypothetical protein